jgi:hypothetical protein
MLLRRVIELRGSPEASRGRAKAPGVLLFVECDLGVDGHNSSLGRLPIVGAPDRPRIWSGLPGGHTNAREFRDYSTTRETVRDDFVAASTFEQ